MNDFKLNRNEKITSGFKVPENYFDGFSEKVMQQLPKEEPKVISFYAKNKKILFSIAAVLVIALSISLVFKIQNKEQEMSSDEVENYLVYHTNLSDDYIVSLLEQEDIENIKVSNSIENEAIEDILSNNSELEQYITNEN